VGWLVAVTLRIKATPIQRDDVLLGTDFGWGATSNNAALICAVKATVSAWKVKYS
jgi:hypothetical protein